MFITRKMVILLGLEIIDWTKPEERLLKISQITEFVWFQKAYLFKNRDVFAIFTIFENL